MLLYNGPLLCSFNVPTKGLSLTNLVALCPLRRSSVEAPLKLALVKAVCRTINGCSVLGGIQTTNDYRRQSSR